MSMDQNVGISILSPPRVTENSMGKSKGVGINLRTSVSLNGAKEKLKTPWVTSLFEEHSSVWDKIILVLAEIVGTAILIFMGCMGCVGSMGFTPSLMQICFGFGFAVLTAIQCVGHVSGCHINPAISVAAMILGKLSLPMTIIYITGQCLGAVLGFGLLKALTPEGFLHGGNANQSQSFCTTDLHADLSVSQGVLCEVVATGILVFFVCGSWDSRNVTKEDSIPIRFALCVSVLCFIFAPYTGASLNPARTFGPAVWNGYWSNHWVYWVGPIVGAIVASLFYKFFFLPKTHTIKSTRQTNGNIPVET